MNNRFDNISNNIIIQNISYIVVSNRFDNISNNIIIQNISYIVVSI